MDHKSKIQFIYDNINKINNHINYIKLLDIHDTQYTKNSNGIFVNLNKLDEKIIDDFYFRISKELINGNDIEDKYEKQIIYIKQKSLKINKTQKTINKNVITADMFDPIDREIIELSKKYHIN